ncbi:hypothetical protein GCM10010954_21590 [Halobacillus andaensis]|uniref:Uncharacterized protein n=1 Tax=Halobacillus andaensis TaxID=1176239 RepID=A0A917EXW2_HALAA|nr:hypothetical protein [Halobacillus andaensis]MBP2004332.1 ATP/ADP translocase [Halobacillus andaensis]GGF22464.1 hypothetical protein GCM10010954_21590 [Halobacillus andaensis]
MRTDAIIFVLSTIVCIAMAIFLSKYLTNKGFKKGALIIPSLLLGTGLGVVISIMAGGTFVESLVVIGVMVLISLGYTLGLARMRKTYPSLTKNK